jgi:hypothetical protein
MGWGMTASGLYGVQNKMHSYSGCRLWLLTGVLASTVHTAEFSRKLLGPYCHMFTEHFGTYVWAVVEQSSNTMCMSERRCHVGTESS